MTAASVLATVSSVPVPLAPIKGAHPNDRVVASGWYRPHGRRWFRNALDSLEPGQPPLQHSLYDINWWTEMVTIFKNGTAPAAAAPEVILPVPGGDRFPLALGWYRSHRAASRNTKRDTLKPRTRKLLYTTHSNVY